MGLTKIFQFLKLLDLFNVKNKLEASEMKSIAPDMLFALIDQEALAVSKIEDEGKTPRYSEDFIHLYDHGGYKHYRMYMEKVAFQLYTSWFSFSIQECNIDIVAQHQ